MKLLKNVLSLGGVLAFLLLASLSLNARFFWGEYVARQQYSAFLAQAQVKHEEASFFLADASIRAAERVFSQLDCAAKESACPSMRRFARMLNEWDAWHKKCTTKEKQEEVKEGSPCAMENAPPSPLEILSLLYEEWGRYHNDGKAWGKRENEVFVLVFEARGWISKGLPAEVRGQSVPYWQARVIIFGILGEDDSAPKEHNARALEIGLRDLADRWK